VKRSFSVQKVLAALEAGDAMPLIDLHRAMFGDARMEGEDDGGGEDDENDEGSEEEDDDADDGGTGGDGKKKSATEVAALKRENAERRKAAAALKKQNEELAAKLKQHEDAGKGELEKVSDELKSVAAERDDLKTKNENLLIQNAFLIDNKYSWNNPRAALRLADLSEVEIDEDGNVTGLAEALDALAKSDAYLLKGKGDKDDDDEGKPGATGQPPGKKAKGNVDREKLLNKYPALRR